MAPRNRNSTERSASSESRYSRAEFARDFPDDDACLEWLKNHLYPDGIFCKNCQKVTAHYRVKSRPSYSCQSCGNHVHPTAGTIFHKSSTSLHLWFQAIYLMSSTRCGVSAKHIEREIGVTYKTAHRMAKLIRQLLEDGEIRQTGEVEIDETYFTSSKRLGDVRKPGVTRNKRAVIGSVERGGRVVATYVGPNADLISAEHHLRTHVLPEAIVFSDEWKGYTRQAMAGRTHFRVKHAAGIYVDGPVHTQTIEGFWSLLKRGIGGTYHSVSSRYLQHYLDEYAFRYNHREDPQPMFFAFLARVARVGAQPSAGPALGGATPC